MGRPPYPLTEKINDRYRQQNRQDNDRDPLKFNNANEAFKMTPIRRHQHRRSSNIDFKGIKYSWQTGWWLGEWSPKRSRNLFAPTAAAASIGAKSMVSIAWNISCETIPKVKTAMVKNTSGFTDPKNRYEQLPPTIDWGSSAPALRKTSAPRPNGFLSRLLSPTDSPVSLLLLKRCLKDICNVLIKGIISCDR